jgi:hypothetical protein
MLCCRAIANAALHTGSATEIMMTVTFPCATAAARGAILIAARMNFVTRATPFSARIATIIAFTSTRIKMDTSRNTVLMVVI